MTLSLGYWRQQILARRMELDFPVPGLPCLVLGNGERRGPPRRRNRSGAPPHRSDLRKDSRLTRVNSDVKIRTVANRITEITNMDNPITCVASIVHRLAGDLSHADRQEIISAALVRVAAGTEHALSAVRWSLADWLRDQTETPAPVDDVDLKRALQRARRSVRSASDEELAKWDSLLSRLPERERDVAVRLAAGYSHRDIGAELRINHGTVTRVVARIRGRFVDTCIWYPILDALHSLPNTKQARAEYVTDLSEYRQPRTAHRSSAPIVAGETTEHRTPIRTTWFVPCHVQRPAPMKWYPGMLIKRWEPSNPSGLWATCWECFQIGPKHAGKRSSEDVAETALSPREVLGLSDGRRWFFEHPTHGTMLSSQVIRREFDAAGVFRPHVR